MKCFLHWIKCYFHATEWFPEKKKNKPSFSVKSVIGLLDQIFSTEINFLKYLQTNQVTTSPFIN